MQIDTLETFPTDWRRKPKFTRETVRGIKPYKSITELLDKILTDGRDPVAFINEKITQGIQVVGLGETHDSSTIHQSEAIIVENLTNNSKRPLKHIAREFSIKLQPIVDSFMTTGDPTRLQRVFHWHHYVLDMIDFARKHDIKVHLIDGNLYRQLQTLNPLPVKDIRDKIIHERIARISRTDPYSLTLAILGSNHVSYSSDAKINLVPDRTYPKLNDLLPHTYLPIAYHTIGQRDLKKLKITLPKTGLLVSTGTDSRFDVSYSGQFNDYCGNLSGIIFVSDFKPPVSSQEE